MFVMSTLNIVEQPSDGTSPKLVAKQFAKKVKGFLATTGAGEVALLKSADWAYCWQ